MKNISFIKIQLINLFLLALVLTAIGQPAPSKPKWKEHRALIYTRNGKGYVHENIPSAVACLINIAKEKGFVADVTDDPSVFNKESLKNYSLLVFASTNNDVFDTDEQRLTFRQYIEGGGGFVGVHSVVGTERNWTWFKMMLGGTFDWHPPFQRYKIQIVEPNHPSVAGLPKVWEKEDECYFIKEMYPGIKPVLAHDLTTLNETEKERIKTIAGPFSNWYPAAWCQNFDGGIIWITALGHDKKDYSDPIFVKHLSQGIAYVASNAKKPVFSKAYALSKDDPMR